jgi:hypothetical protein
MAMLFITPITLNEQGTLQKRARLPGFSRGVEDAEQNSRRKFQSTDLMLNMTGGQSSQAA